MPPAPRIFGQLIDPQTRCVHYHGAADVVAIRFKCCDRYYPCIECHAADAGHPAVRWPESEWDTPAIWCGVCHATLTIRAYLACGHHCPACRTPFNPGCANHYHLYFETKG